MSKSLLLALQNTGSLIKASKRFQINIEIKPTKFFRPMKKAPSMLMPILWADEVQHKRLELKFMKNDYKLKTFQFIHVFCYDCSLHSFHFAVRSTQ